MQRFPVFIVLEPQAPFGVDLDINATVDDVIAEVISEKCLHKYYSIRIGDECYADPKKPLSETNAASDVTILVYLDTKKIDTIVEYYRNKTYTRYFSPTNHSDFSVRRYLCPILYLSSIKESNEAEIKLIIMQYTKRENFKKIALRYLIRGGYYDSAKLFVEQCFLDAWSFLYLLASCNYESSVKWREYIKILILKGIKCHRVPREYYREPELIYATELDEGIYYKFELEKIREEVISLGGVTPEQFDEAIKYDELV